MRRVWILVPAALLLSACGGTSKKPEGSSTATGPPLQIISLSEKEYSITPSSISVSKPGSYAFKVTNDGKITHALEVEGNGVEEKTEHIAPGSSSTLTVDLSKNGDYEVYCPIDGHRKNGMEASLTVGGAASSGGGTTSEQQTSTGQTSTEKKGGYGY